MNNRNDKSIAFMVIFFSIFSCSAFAKELFFIADDIDAAPYVSGDSETQPVGIFYDTIKSVFKRMGVPIKYEVHPWKRAQMLVRNKQADALITIPTPTRLTYLVASQEPVFTMKYKIFTQHDNQNIPQIRSVKNLANLKGLKIIDYLGDGWAEKNLAKHGIHWAPSLSAACKMIVAYRGDVFLQDEMMVLHAIKNIKNTGNYWKLKFEHIISFDAPIDPIGFHLLIRNDSNFLKLLPKFDETIKAMRKDGELDTIKDKWIN